MVQDAYDQQFIARVFGASETELELLLNLIAEQATENDKYYGDVRIEYRDNVHFVQLAGQLGLMEDAKVFICHAHIHQHHDFSLSTYNWTYRHVTQYSLIVLRLCWAPATLILRALVCKKIKYVFIK